MRLTKGFQIAAALALAATLVASAGKAAAQVSGPTTARGATILIRNATVLTVTRGTLTGASVLVRDGKIAAVGTNVQAPSGAIIIDATGKYVTPGIIDCHSHIAVQGDVNEIAPAVSAMVAIEDVINPEDRNIYLDLTGGVTTANVLHGSANAIGGKNAIIKLRWTSDARGLLFEGAKPGIKFALGENPKHTNFGFNPPRYPQTRLGVEDVIRDAFKQAREYKRDWDEYNKKPVAERANFLQPRRNFTLDPLVEILEGKRLVHAHCYRADEILMLIRVANEFGFKIATFQHVLEGYKVAKEIAGHGAGASTFSDWWAFKIEAYDAIPHNAALMTRKGVLVSINSDSAEEARHLNQEAAKAMRFGGLTEDEALALVTINPARQLQIEKRVGSIEVGKDADLVIYKNHPLSAYAMVEKVLIDGRVYFDRDKDLAEREKLASEKAALIEKEKARMKEAERKEAEKKAEPRTTPQGRT